MWIAKKCSSQKSRRTQNSVGAVVALSLVLVACGSGSDGAASSMPANSAVAGQQVAADPLLTVVVSDPSLRDLVARVAGNEVEVVSLVPMGADGHTYQPVPGDARTLAGADVYIENGMGLNDVVSAFAFTNYPDGTVHYMLSDVIPEEEVLATDSADEVAAHGHPHSFNAHFWPDPVYAALYVGEIARILSATDPDGAAGYGERATALSAQLEQMDAAFETALATIPQENRKLVVYHDSWSYYGRRYGIPVIGAIQPTDFSEPSAAELRDTIEQVRAAAVPAFFGSEVFPSDVLDVIAEESGAAYVSDLSDDELPGEPGSPEHSYVGMMVANTRSIVSALGGNPSALDTIVL